MLMQQHFEFQMLHLLKLNKNYTTCPKKHVTLQLLGFTFKESSKQVDDYGDIYGYSDGVYPYTVVDDDANTCAQRVGQREDGKS